MALEFNQSYRHERLEFLPGVPLGFDDPNAERFFTKVGVASAVTAQPVRVYSKDEVSIDPDTIFADGTKVLEAPEGGPTAVERQGTIQPADVTVEVGNG